MILAQFGTLKFHSQKSNRTWDNSGNKEQHILFSHINQNDYVLIPSVQLIVEEAFGTPELKVYSNKYDTLLGTFTMTKELDSGYDRLIFKGEYSDQFISGEDYLYMTVTNGVYTYYSDVFAITSDTSKLLRIDASSSDFAMGARADYRFNMDEFNYVGYFNVWERKQPLFEEEEFANEDDGLTVPYYLGSSKQLSWVISGNEYILDFLARLRVLMVNGVVTFTWKNELYRVAEAETEIDESYNDGELLDIEVKIKPYSDVMSVINQS